ncbi:hypothetical protein [Sinorhizobium sp. BG8]|uniref:hypothetical protein n=1 Tax=Sinorhizobium sp. BG8 TaxID=2613773 RepID=UPI00193C8A17|nr:hypothetical protein [Sinorhizobium sp. BG8]QRM54164.1 hypothetical protein F3Y30_06065 [Sinorhizobium sp. BG8]
MSDVPSPRHGVDDPDRSSEARTIFENALRSLVKDAVIAGWRESEVAMLLADAAENYIMYLAAKPDHARFAANSNRISPLKPMSS